eukprot:m.360655 g.360655  ORF g.360655 m.360655 type:complete len:406 (+) comp19142_c0_seq1:121-1338(+)
MSTTTNPTFVGSSAGDAEAQRSTGKGVSSAAGAQSSSGCSRWVWVGIAVFVVVAAAIGVGVGLAVGGGGGGSKSLKSFSTDGKDANLVRWSPDSTRVVSTNDLGVVMVWDVSGDKASSWGLEATFQQGFTDADAIDAFAFNPTGSYIVMGYRENGLVEVWDASNADASQWASVQTLANPGGFTGILALEFNTAGTMLLGVRSDNKVDVWNTTSADAADWALIRSLSQSGATADATFSKNGELLACAVDNAVVFWNISSVDSNSWNEFQSFSGGAGFVWFTSLDFNNDDTLLASASFDTSVTLWDISNADSSQWAVAKRFDNVTSDGHQEYVLTLDFNPAGTQLASGAGDDTIKLWDVSSANSADWTLSRTIEAGDYRDIMSVAYNSDGTRLASASEDDTVKVWSV